jgi:L,D-peptidoglycan transpeptidase YkuD (ErfK/YbiS/YcfS/YnhG family)
MKTYALLICLSLATTLAHAFELPKSSSQCIVGIVDDWNSSHVTLSFYDKRNGNWQQIKDKWQGRIGAKGLAWGRGLHPISPGTILKKEGDSRSPIGVFDLGGVWGTDRSVKRHPNTHYHQVSSRDLWVEDSESKFYNQFLTLPHEPSTPWEKSAQMKQNDHAHSLKLFISHNAPPNAIPHGGSAIFFHIWRNDGNSASSGCTTMSEDRLRWLINAIDPGRRPLYILLPRSEYAKLKPFWKLP